jgi:hypothetical protein
MMEDIFLRAFERMKEKIRRFVTKPIELGTDARIAFWSLPEFFHEYLSKKLPLG